MLGAGNIGVSKMAQIPKRLTVWLGREGERKRQRERGREREREYAMKPTYNESTH